MTRPPLSTPLSHALVAFTIELDNEFERRFAQARVGRRFGTSLVMWSNFLRFVGDGITVGELPAAAGLPKSRLLSMVGGMERWRYVFVGPEPAERPPESKRDGYGSARGLRQDWIVRPAEAGRVAQELWPPLFGEIERRWEERFGTDEIRELRGILETDRRAARRRAARVPPARGQRERDGRGDHGANDRRRRSGRPSAHAPRSGAARLHPRLRARVRGVPPAVRQLPARARRRGTRRPRASPPRRRLEGGDEHGAAVPDEGRPRRGPGEARGAHAERPRGGAGGSPSARRRRAGVGAAVRRRQRPRLRAALQRVLEQRRNSRRACSRTRTAGGRPSPTSSRPTPCSTTRPAGSPRTRWCCTAAAGPTAASRA